MGITATTSVWTDQNVNWEAFDLVVANGAWDNIHRPDEFLSRADGVAARTPVVNSPATLRWNMDKRYLAALDAAGVPTVPTLWLHPTDPPSSDLPAGEIVVKPAISGGGFETARYEAQEGEVARSHIDRLLDAGRTVMVQPYQESVDAQGEVGLVFLGSRFSHAIGKGPVLRPGAAAAPDLLDNLVISRASPTGAQLQAAHHALSVAEDLHGPTTYARVDLVTLADGTPAVLELELLDPALFFEIEPAGAHRFALVLQEVLEERLQSAD